MSTAVKYQFLEPRPKSAYRQLFVKGTRIRAEILYRACTALEELLVSDNGDPPRAPEEVAEDYGLPLEAVLEAVEYCRSNPPEIAADHAREMRLIDEFDHEIARTRQNARLMSLLDERAKQSKTIPLDEVKRRLGLTP